MLIDTHCHLDEPSISARLHDAIQAADRAGVKKFIVPGVHPAGWGRVASLAAERQCVYPAFGLHPMYAGLCDKPLLARLAKLCSSAVAIGEIGLDYTLSDVSRETQISAFRLQLKLALEAHLPVIIHCRKAFQDLLDIVKEDGGESIGGVLHAFSGSPQMAAEFVKLGFYLSVAGTVTYRNAVRPLEVVRSIPLEHLLLETDAPDMTPEPYRGCPNEPAFIIETASRVAQLKGITLDEVAAVTTLNASRLFRLP